MSLCPGISVIYIFGISLCCGLHKVCVYLQEIENKVISPEKAEEAKLKARYPHLGAKPGGSDFLRKRLQKGVSLLNSSTQHGLHRKYT